ncbi:MAG: hypothetical protein ABI324_24185 [Ktedonobacteraceae bacterium]
MLKTWYHDIQSLPTSQEAGSSLEATITLAFDRMVDLLRSSDTFPNPEINQLLTLAWRLIGNKEILIVGQEDLPTLHFAGTMQGRRRMAAIFLPLTFLDLLRDDPTMQLGGMTNMASHAKDYSTHKLDQHTYERASASEADMLLTLRQLHEEESIVWQPNPYQQSLLRAFPHGLASLAPGVQYPTPSYPNERDVPPS